ncbi:rho GTPase-activating protein 4-like isoform X2 [Eucyclogobius newberryi]|uniref:rho GTPase-activating protein 4-like isoform X2 n=1 Tax=Eucyclogobius newberryi TaxID=166745 RepID=UPI003B594C82
MTSHVKPRKDKVGMVDYDTQIKEVRCQLVDQLKVLDLQLEHKSQQLQDLTDYLRRRGEIESEYARSLEKLAERFTSRIKRKDPSNHSVSKSWVALLSQTREESKDHNLLSETCCTFIIQPLNHCLEYTQRLAKKSRDICTSLQDGLLKVTTEMQTAWRTYYQYHSDYVSAEGKLKEAEKQEEKHKTGAKKLERLIEKRQIKVKDVYLKCSKGRNDYLLNLSAANASMNKYYLQDISTLIDVTEVSLESEMICELDTRFKQIQTRLKALTDETEEASKSMSAAQSMLVDCICEDDLELSAMAQENSSESVSVQPSVARRKANVLELETAYFTRVKDFLVNSSLVNKLQAKHDLLKVALEKAEASNGHQPRHKFARVKKNCSSANLMHNQKLFNKDLLSFIADSGQQIPIVVESCIRFINLNGLHHEGIFRVPGSQMEVNSLRDAFEQGEDPLTQQRYNLDSVAGVLKLYFRGLKNPLFPLESTGQLLEYAQIKGEADRAAQLKMVVASYPKPIIVVMRYLFAFLHHVSQYSDENMMQPYNLAVCFGPSLVRGASEDDAVMLQPQINDLVKSIILLHELIFPSQSEVPGPVYEKCMTEEDDCEPVMEEEAEVVETSQDSEVNISVEQSSVPIQKKAERPRANSCASSEKGKWAAASAGGSIGSSGKGMLQIPLGHQFIPRRVYSPGFVRKELRESISNEDIVQLDKDVCHQMDSVFKELLARQASPSSTFSPSARAPQKIGRRDVRRGRGAGLFKSADAFD